ncbi:hypothetical protein C9890_0169 [Perkinsus sp. BL_2016]|nr:hypothetical protein C9890_0169 [Perkinsus sp. BL_2016]
MQRWMVTFLERHGFWGVFLMAAWPNAMFDLCGLCCGHFLMPFWTFFGAVVLGKAVVKASGQLLFFTALFSEKSRKILLNNTVSLAEKLGFQNGHQERHLMLFRPESHAPLHEEHGLALKARHLDANH